MTLSPLQRASITGAIHLASIALVVELASRGHAAPATILAGLLAVCFASAVYGLLIAHDALKSAMRAMEEISEQLK